MTHIQPTNVDTAPEGAEAGSGTPAVSTALPAPIRVELRCLASPAAYADIVAPLTAALERTGIVIASAENPARTGDPVVFVGCPESWERFYDRRSYGVLTCEASTLPETAIAGLSRVDAIFVPSEWCAQVVRAAAPAHVPVVVALPGVDAETFALVERERGARLRVLVDVGRDTTARNGADLAISAFVQAFPERDDVELVIRSSAPLDLQRPDLRVSFSTARLSAADRARFYAAFDVLVHVPRCDADALTALEALATGLPVISADAGALATLTDGALPVAAREIPAYGAAAAPDARWYEVDALDVAARLHEIDRYRDRLIGAAGAAARHVAETHTWDATAAVIRARLDA